MFQINGNIKRYIIYLFLLFIIIAFTLNSSLAQVDQLATVHGSIYKPDSYELLDNSIVKVNSTPPQSQIAKEGFYSFVLSPGNYTINASYYKNQNLFAYKEENIVINQSGDYLIDIILLPVSNSSLDFTEILSSAKNDPSLILQDKNTLNVFILTIIAIFIFIGIIILIFFSKRKSNENNDISTEDILVENLDSLPKYVSEGEPLPEDLQQVMNILVANGGRISQRDLRHKIKYSEAKVSLMVSDLENRGIIEKFKKGRGNILIIKNQNDQNI